jgi:RNA polymerase sigma factor (sigma-70 family)
MANTEIDPSKHLGLLMKECWRFARTPLARTAAMTSREDWLADGWVLLCGAAERFDASKGYQFSTFATRTIRMGLITAAYQHMGCKLKGGHTKLQRRYRLPVVCVEHAEWLPDRSDPPAEMAEDIAELWWALDRCDSRNREILLMRAGGLTLQEIAVAIGRSKERSRQLYDAGIIELRRLVGAAAA